MTPSGATAPVCCTAGRMSPVAFSARSTPERRYSALRRGFVHQSQADAVDAVTLIGRSAVTLALENVAEVAVAVRAEHFRAHHAHRAVLAEDHAVRGQRGEERRP